jgi:hypothetical protein
MKQEIEINEWIERFLNGDLPADERVSFLKKMEEDPDFAREVELHRQLHKIITDGAYLNIKSKLKSIHLEKKRISKKVRRITGFGIGGLIIGVILLWVLSDTRNTKNEKNLQSVIVREDTVAVQDHKNPLSENTPETAIKITSGTPSADQGPGAEKLPDIALRVEPALAKEPIQAEVPVENKGPKSEKQLSEPVSENKTTTGKTETMRIPDCRKIKIEGSFREYESCNNRPTGSIAIDKESLTGGQAPYTFSLDKINFHDTLLFSGLYPTSYALYARDANECIGLIGTALIRSVDCTNAYQAVFAPLRGEIWTVPIDPDRSGTLNIFSKNAALVYSIRFTANETVVWSGTTLSGLALPMGLYQFGISYDDGGSFVGNVTILK